MTTMTILPKIMYKRKSLGLLLFDIGHLSKFPLWLFPFTSDHHKIFVQLILQLFIFFVYVFHNPSGHIKVLLEHNSLMGDEERIVVAFLWVQLDQFWHQSGFGGEVTALIMGNVLEQWVSLGLHDCRQKPLAELPYLLAWGELSLCKQWQFARELMLMYWHTSLLVWDWRVLAIRFSCDIFESIQLFNVAELLCWHLRVSRERQSWSLFDESELYGSLVTLLRIYVVPHCKLRKQHLICVIAVLFHIYYLEPLYLFLQFS